MLLRHRISFKYVKVPIGALVVTLSVSTNKTDLKIKSASLPFKCIQPGLELWIMQWGRVHILQRERCVLSRALFWVRSCPTWHAPQKKFFFEVRTFFISWLQKVTRLLHMELPSVTIPSLNAIPHCGDRQIYKTDGAWIAKSPKNAEHTFAPLPKALFIGVRVTELWQPEFY
jgi:hypothetical protein